MSHEHPIHACMREATKEVSRNQGCVDGRMIHGVGLYEDEVRVRVSSGGSM